MRQQFINTKSKEYAQKICPWANNIERVCEGYMCFESEEDCNTWKNQN